MNIGNTNYTLTINSLLQRAQRRKSLIIKTQQIQQLKAFQQNRKQNSGQLLNPLFKRDTKAGYYTVHQCRSKNYEKCARTVQKMCKNNELRQETDLKLFIHSFFDTLRVNNNKKQNVVLN